MCIMCFECCMSSLIHYCSDNHSSRIVLFISTCKSLLHYRSNYIYKSCICFIFHIAKVIPTTPNRILSKYYSPNNTLSNHGCGFLHHRIHAPLKQCITVAV